MKRQLLGAVALTVAMAFGAALPASAKTFIYCSEGSPENFNPQINTTGTSFDAAYPVFNRLVEFKPGTTTVIPALAEKWSVSDDGLTYTLHLRKGVKFHSNKSFTPTRDFNADDVIATFNRMWKQDDPYYKVSGGAYDYFNDMGMPDLLQSIDKVDDNTIKITLKKPNAPFLADLAMDFAAIHSKEYMDAMLKAGTPEMVDQNPIGTGPFEFVSYEKDAVIRYKAFPSYFRGKQKIDNLVFAITPDAAVRMAKLEAGECDLAPYPSPADLPKLMADKKLKVESQAGLNVGYLAFNTEKPPFDKKEVRQALNMAIDKAAIIKAVYQSAGQPAKNPIPPTIWSYDKSITAWPYDPAKAQAMLKAAGVTNLRPTSGTCRCSVPTIRTPRRSPRWSRPIWRRSASPPSSRPSNGASTASACRRARTRWASSAGPAITAIRTTSWACCSPAAQRGPADRTSPSGATRTSPT